MAMKQSRATRALKYSISTLTSILSTERAEGFFASQKRCLVKKCDHGPSKICPYTLTSEGAKKYLPWLSLFS